MSSKMQCERNRRWGTHSLSLGGTVMLLVCGCASENERVRARMCVTESVCVYVLECLYYWHWLEEEEERRGIGRAGVSERGREKDEERE